MAAQSVIKDLQIALKQLEKIDRKSFESILAQPEIIDLGSLSVTLIGWIVEDTSEYCFRWNSTYPSELFYDEAMYDGSGAEEAMHLLGERGIRSLDVKEFRDFENLATSMLGTVTNLMKAEVVGPSFRRFGFGFAYEAIMLNENRQFEYINNILYYALVHVMDDKGRYQTSRFIGKPMKVTERNGVAIVHKYDPDKNEQSLNVILPVGAVGDIDLPMLEKDYFSENYPSLFSADYYCSYIIFESPGFYSSPSTETFCGEKIKELVDKVAPSSFNLHVDPARIEWAYKLIKSDMERRMFTSD